MVRLLPSPIWFNLVDLGLAYLPMAYLGYMITGGQESLAWHWPIPPCCACIKAKKGPRKLGPFLLSMCRGYFISKRSRFITLVQAVTKS